MKKIIVAVTLISLVGCGGSMDKSVVVDGSSTVFRISKTAQGEFSKQDGAVDIVVESHGTGGGFGRYLAGEVDIVDASRPAKEEESSKATGDLEWVQHKVAYDGITVVVNPANDFVNELSLDQLKKIWEAGSKVVTWKDIIQVGPTARLCSLVPTRILVHLNISQRQSIISPALYRDWETDRKSTRLNSSHRL